MKSTAHGLERIGHKPVNLVVALQVLVLLPLIVLAAGSALAAEQSLLPELGHSPTHSPLIESPFSSIAPSAKATTSVGSFLDAEGRLALPADFSGSLDPVGFEMMLDEDGAPRFVPQGGLMEPDDQWDDQFFLGSGCDGQVLAIVQGTSGEIYLGGDFVTCGGVVANGIVRFEPGTQTWSALGSDEGSGVNCEVRALVVSGGTLYVGGSFTEANVGAAIPAGRIARWDGSAWSALGSGQGNGLDNVVHALAMVGSDLYVGGEFFQANIGAAIDAFRIARWDGAVWSAVGVGDGQGVSGTVRALAVSGDDLYIGGEFSFVNMGFQTIISARRIVRWSGGAWSHLGSGEGNGVNDTVHALAVSGTDLYLGGEFTNVNMGIQFPPTARRVARWDGNDWSVMGGAVDNGVNDRVFSLAVSGDNLYVGGFFFQARDSSGNVAVRRIARWNGTAWSKLGSGNGLVDNNGVSGIVYALAMSGSDLFVGGNFTEANVPTSVTVNHIASWNGTDWSALGSGAGNGANNSVHALAKSGGNLYVGGSFTELGGIAANRIARWDGVSWSALGSEANNGASGTVYALGVSGNDLYVGGQFSLVNFSSINTQETILARNIALWDGLTWSALGTGGGDGVSARVNALVVTGSDLYVGGLFTQANVDAPITANYIARWDGAEWSTLGSEGGNGTSNTVSALALSGNDLYAGGSFTQVNCSTDSVCAGLAANRIAHWNGHSWSALGSGGGNGVNDTVYALAVSGSDLYVGGMFTQVNVGAAISANHIARWSDGAWSVLGSGGGNGLNGAVWSLAASGSDLYAGGDFTQANVPTSIAVNHIARWDGDVWSALGSGVDDSVWALTLTDAGGIFAGGDFQQAGNKASSRFGRHFSASAEVLPPRLDFGDIDPGNVSALQVAVFKNTGETTIEVTELSISGLAAADFTVVTENCTGLTLLLSDSCSIELLFEPSVSDVRSALLEINTNLFAAPFGVELLGNGDGIWHDRFESNP